MSSHRIPTSPLSRLAPRLTAEQGGQSYNPKPRTVVHSQIFWLNMAIPFTSVLNETPTAFTEPEGFDSVVRASWTDLRFARAKFIETQTDRSWSIPKIPIRAVAGAADQVQPLVPLPDPVFLEARAQIRADFLNSGTEAAGRVCFFSELAGLEGRIEVKRSMGFWMLADLGAVNSTTEAINSDFLIWGATTNCANTIIGRIFNETTNFAWSSAQIPMRAMAGLDGQPQPISRFHRPYLLPANVKLRAEINTAVAGNYIAFFGERILL